MRNSAARLGAVFGAGRGLAGLAGRVVRAALLAEARCAGCGCVVPGTACGALCPQCAEAVAPQRGGACPGCGEVPGGMSGEAFSAVPGQVVAGAVDGTSGDKSGKMPGGMSGEAFSAVPGQVVAAAVDGTSGDKSGKMPGGMSGEAFSVVPGKAVVEASGQSIGEKFGEAVGETSCEAQAALCARCQASPRPWGRVLVYGAYEGRLKDMILGYKFEDRLDFGRRLQECALAAFRAGLAAHPELSGCEALVPVPLHPRRLLARGFNQSRELARLLSARHGLPIWQEALVRVRRTTPQMRLARGARAENIRGAFAGRAEFVSGRHILLVDDIMTTGATLEECARALLNAGAKRVDVLALARA